MATSNAIWSNQKKKLTTPSSSRRFFSFSKYIYCPGRKIKRNTTKPLVVAPSTRLLRTTDSYIKNIQATEGRVIYSKFK
jgi:hypothetical protein